MGLIALAMTVVLLGVAAGVVRRQHPRRGRPTGAALMLAWLLVPALPALAQVHVGVTIALPGVHIGVAMPSPPRLTRVPGQQVYYDKRAGHNYFRYSNRYWVYAQEDWYSSRSYNGPWHLSGRDGVPVQLLRVPVRYYAQPPGYFRGWNASAAPRWNEHWGTSWAQRRAGWERADPARLSTAAPVGKPDARTCRPGQPGCGSGDNKGKAHGQSQGHHRGQSKQAGHGESH